MSKQYVGYGKAKQVYDMGIPVKIIGEAEGFGYERAWNGVEPGDLFTYEGELPPPPTKTRFDIIG